MSMTVLTGTLILIGGGSYLAKETIILGRQLLKPFRLPQRLIGYFASMSLGTVCLMVLSGQTYSRIQLAHPAAVAYIFTLGLILSGAIMEMRRRPAPIKIRLGYKGAALVKFGRIPEPSL